MLSRNTVASRAGLHRSASINSVSAPCRVHKKCAANEGDAGEQRVEPFNKVCSVAARDLLLAQAPDNGDSVLVRVVRIGHMRVPVRHRLMPVRMAVRTQCLLLTEPGRSGPMPLSELCTRVSLEKSRVSRAVDAMVERGVATKEPNPDDARSWLVTLTDEGERTVMELNQTLDAHASELLGSLSERDRANVERSLLLFLKALREDTAAICSLPAPERKETKSCC